MTAVQILTAICFAAVLFLVYFLVALFRDARKHKVVAYLLRPEPTPLFDNTFDGTWKQSSSVSIARHHSRRSRHMAPARLSSQKRRTSYGSCICAHSANDRRPRRYRMPNVASRSALHGCPAGKRPGKLPPAGVACDSPQCVFQREHAKVAQIAEFFDRVSPRALNRRLYGRGSGNSNSQYAFEQNGA